MTTLLFHISSLLGGGIEKVLIELLWGLDPAKYRIRLSIAHNLGALEVNRDQIPPYVEVTYILDSPVLTNTKKKKVSKTITVPEKFFEDFVLPLFKKRKHILKLRELIKDTDIVIDFDMTLAGYTGLMQNTKKVAYCHFSFVHYWGGNKRKLDKHANRLRRYDKVVMLCDEMKDNAVALYPFLKDNTVRIYNALNIDRVKTLSLETLEGWKLPGDGYFVSIGRLAESQKDFTMLIKGYAACVKKYSIKEGLVIVGAGPDWEALEMLAKDESVGDRVLFTGFQDNPYKWMANSRLFLFCSKFEGLPTVLIEALSLSCPVIATATPTGVQEILMHGNAGMLIEPGNIAALSEAIFLLHNNAPLRQSFRENAKDIIGRFEIKYMIGEFERLIIE